MLEGKNKKRTSQVRFFYRTFFADFADFFNRNTTDLIKKYSPLFDIFGEKTTLECQFLFSLGTF